MLFQQNKYPTWKAWNLTNLTQKWVNGTATNNGVVLWATNETTNGYDLRFHSSDAQPPNANPPVLEVTYSTDAATKTVYFLKDHLGSIRATVLDSATAPVRGYDDYDPWGYALALRTKKTPYDSLQKIAKNKFTGKEWDDEFGVNWYHFDWRQYDPQIGRWVVHDPLDDYYSPYVYVRNNPVLFFDADGRSTVTDSTGKVIHVNTTDNNLSVYRTSTVTGGVNELGIEGGPMSVKEKVGETHFIDEFVDPESGEAKGQIVFGASWEETIEKTHKEAMKMDLIDIARESKPGGTFDIKAGSPIEGRLLEGKYVTKRSAGNYLAAYNARHGTLFGAHISYTTFVKLAGALHQGKFNSTNAAKIVLFGTSYGPPPWYGEIEYAGRMFPMGWNRRKK